MLHELVKVLGASVLTLIPNTQQPPSMLRQYAELMVAQQTKPVVASAPPAPAAAAAAPTTAYSADSENIDPNATAGGGADLAAGFMERLKSLREKYNIKKADDAPADMYALLHVPFMHTPITQYYMRVIPKQQLYAEYLPFHAHFSLI